jgi:hypothetical protein
MATLPTETKDAILWAEQQQWTDFGGFTHSITLEQEDAQPLIDKTTEYFAEHKITYGTFSYTDCIPIIEEIKAERWAAANPAPEPIEEPTEEPTEETPAEVVDEPATEEETVTE